MPDLARTNRTRPSRETNERALFIPKACNTVRGGSTAAGCVRSLIRAASIMLGLQSAVLFKTHRYPPGEFHTPNRNPRRVSISWLGTSLDRVVQPLHRELNVS